MNALKNGLLYGSMFLILVLLCPAAAQAAGPGAGAYTVAKGDCLWNIAARKDVFGDPWKWPLLFEANRGQISNPDLIQPGWSLALMAAPTAEQIAQAKAFARSYKEGASKAPPGPRHQAPVEAAPVVAAPAVAPVTAQPVAPAEETKPSLALPMASILLVLALIAGVVYRKMKQRPSEATATAEPMPVHKEEAAPVDSAAAVEAPAPEPAPVQAPEAEKAPAAAQATESETMLRADQGPDPLHPESHSEDHKNAA
jgi:hypothetical protein